jgi:hypothetical protein
MAARAWRTLPATVEAPPAIPRAGVVATLEAPSCTPALTLVVPPPFVPPRG